MCEIPFFFFHPSSFCSIFFFGLDVELPPRGPGWVMPNAPNCIIIDINNTDMPFFFRTAKISLEKDHMMMYCSGHRNVR